MAFTATIESITPGADGTGAGVAFWVKVNFEDSASGYSSSKNYVFPPNTTQNSAVNTITADGTAIKSSLAQVSNLQSKVGAVITI